MQPGTRITGQARFMESVYRTESTWSELPGMAGLKKALQVDILNYLQHADIARKLGASAPRGVLL